MFADLATLDEGPPLRRLVNLLEVHRFVLIAKRPTHR